MLEQARFTVKVDLSFYFCFARSSNDANKPNCDVDLKGSAGDYLLPSL